MMDRYAFQEVFYSDLLKLQAMQIEMVKKLKIFI